MTTSTQNSEGSRQSVRSKHTGTVDALSWEGLSKKTRSKNDVLSWEGSSIKTRISQALHPSVNSKSSTNTAGSSNQIRKSVSQCSNVPSSTNTVVPSPSHHSYSIEISAEMGGASQHISTPQSGVTAQLPEQDNIWYKIKEEFPTLTDYFQEMQVDKRLPQILTNLFKMKQLPFNPYSQLMCELRPTMERYAIVMIIINIINYGMGL